MLSVRKALPADFGVIMPIYRIAQDFMISTGNPNQWGHFNPREEQIREDIENGICHVICEDGVIHGVFALCPGEDPTYGYIEDGAWLNDEPYVTIHRLAGDGTVKGIFKCAFNYCRQFVSSVRADTHHDNRVMQSAMEKNGFKRCGIIYLKNGSPRIAYQWCDTKSVT
ncbi:MAG: N-acetyltransferase [Lachnospiraceae bacterium]|nr:N-acetyltransferase [Lachnospiraceae bacterium]